MSSCSFSSWFCCARASFATSRRQPNPGKPKPPTRLVEGIAHAGPSSVGTHPNSANPKLGRTHPNSGSNAAPRLVDTGPKPDLKLVEPGPKFDRPTPPFFGKTRAIRPTPPQSRHEAEFGRNRPSWSKPARSWPQPPRKQIAGPTQPVGPDSTQLRSKPAPKLGRAQPKSGRNMPRFGPDHAEARRTLCRLGQTHTNPMVSRTLKRMLPGGCGELNANDPPPPNTT